MKYLKQTILSLLIVTLFCISQGYAQNSNIDINRMNRDIRIMENILQEMFKTRTREMGSGEAFVFEGNTFLRTAGDIRGTYLPGYGVIFMIPYARSPHIISVGNSSDQSFSYRFVYGSEEDPDTEINEESVTNRITEFLRDYGSTIGQLEENDNVMVIFGAQRSSNQNPAFVSLHGDRNKKESIPTISVVAGKADLDAYRTGRLSESDFINRVSVARTGDSEKQQLDMRVMANIFETAFKNTDEKGFRIRGSVNRLKLDNFGALFYFDASYYSDNDLFSLGAAPNIELWQDAEASRSITMARKMKEITEKQMQERQKKEKEQSEVIKTAYESFKTQLKDFIVDYGRTLRSVKSDQHVMVSVTLSKRNQEIPERIDLQIKKSVLEATEKGNMTREQAVGQVVVREY